MALKIVRRYDANGRELTEKDLETLLKKEAVRSARIIWEIMKNSHAV